MSLVTDYDKARRRFHKKRYEAALSRATPKWTDSRIMRAFYHKALQLRDDGVPVQIDHIIPIQHPLVCGLHCEFNLQILLAKENSDKSNSLNWNGEPFDVVLYDGRIYGKC